MAGKMDLIPKYKHISWMQLSICGFTLWPDAPPDFHYLSYSVANQSNNWNGDNFFIFLVLSCLDDLQPGTKQRYVMPADKLPTKNITSEENGHMWRWSISGCVLLPSALCALLFSKSPSLQETTSTTNELGTYTMIIASYHIILSWSLMVWK